MKRIEIQTSLNKESLVSNSSDHSLYIQTTWKLNSQANLFLPEMTAQICFFTSEDANKLSEAILTRNVFARHSRENNFYVSKARALENKTVIEVSREGDPDNIIEEAQQAADILEKVALLSTVLAMNRQHFQNALGIKPFITNQFNITVGKNYRYLRSKSRTPATVKGITIDERFCKRFSRCNFQELASFCASNNTLGKKVADAVYWIVESRQDPSLAVACVKSAIALESLLIFNQSEPLGKNLSERTAFILSDDLEERKQISQVVKDFYTERSEVVHGHKTSTSHSLVENIDVLTTLLCLTIAHNRNLWKTQNDLQNWCEDRKWGKKSDFISPLPPIYLRRALLR